MVAFTPGASRIRPPMDATQQAETHLTWAAWTSLNSGLASFSRDWPARSLPELWWGEDRLPLKDVRRLNPALFGLQGGYYGKGRAIVFVLPASQTAGVDMEAGVYVAGSFNGWQRAIGDPAWRMAPGELRGRPCFLLQVPLSRFDPERSESFKFVTGKGHWLPVPEHTPNTHLDGFGIKNYLFSPLRTGRHLFHFTTPLPLSESAGRLLYFRQDGRIDAVRMGPGFFLKQLEADGPLGALVEGDSTRFRLFAPRARRVRLYLFEHPDGPPGEPVEMRNGAGHVWEARVDGNRHGWYYYYTVAGWASNEAGGFDGTFRVLDPYARAACGPHGPGIVVADEALAAPHVPFTVPHWHDLVIAEAHVRDLTAHAPVEMSPDERLGFAGLRRWVESEDFYLKDLGVNAVELQPVHLFDTVERAEYAWGYMPVNFFAPASQYCADPRGPAQIAEFRELVHAFHRRGIAVLLDVVYNHVGEPNHLQYLDREYYFLLDGDGNHRNHSGCGNTLDASTPMARRLILDSLVHWLRACDVDGFRFDLAELLGRDTLAWLEPRLKAVKPGVVLIAEPWSFRGHIARELRATGFASWNDGYREYLGAYLTLRADAAGLAHFMQGSRPDWSRFPAQTVNYVESHDDRCWIDRITENPRHDGTRPTAADRRRTHLMIGILMMSLGIPMLASGMDMLKSKGGANNTYLRGDLNAIPYARMAEYSGTVEYFRRWISFRLGPLGRLTRLDGFPGSGYFLTARAGSLFGMVYNADRSLGPERLLFAVNPTFEPGTLRFEGLDLGPFEQWADTERWGQPRLQRPLFRIVDRSALLLPPLSCGLFVAHA